MDKVTDHFLFCLQEANGVSESDGKEKEKKKKEKKKEERRPHFIGSACCEAFRGNIEILDLVVDLLWMREVLEAVTKKEKIEQLRKLSERGKEKKRKERKEKKRKED